MHHIGINENGNLEKSFEWPKKPRVGELLRYQLGDEPTQIYVITKVHRRIPKGLSGRISYQINHELQKKRLADQTLVPLVKIEIID